MSEKNVKLSLSDRTSDDEYTYKLLNYKLSFPDRSLSMAIERKDDTYHPIYKNIKEIDMAIHKKWAKVWMYFENIYIF